MLSLMLLTGCANQPKAVPKYSPISIPASTCVTDYIREEYKMPDCVVEWLDKITIQQTRLKENEK